MLQRVIQAITLNGKIPRWSFSFHAESSQRSASPTGKLGFVSLTRSLSETDAVFTRDPCPCKLRSGVMYPWHFMCLVSGRTLLWVAVLGIAVVYIFALAAFAFLRSTLDPNKDGEVHLFCQSLGQCFVTMIRFGFIGELFEVDCISSRFSVEATFWANRNVKNLSQWNLSFSCERVRPRTKGMHCFSFPCTQYRPQFIKISNIIMNCINKLRISLLQFMKPHESELDFKKEATVAIFHICFWIIVTTIGLNIVFGVILDTFSELRSMKVRNEQSDSQSTCFETCLWRFKALLRAPFKGCLCRKWIQTDVKKPWETACMESSVLL